MGLTLRQLPSLLTDCVLIAHGQQAGVVWTQREFFGICLHMLNDNPPNFFLMPFQDKEGRPQYKRAFKADVRKRIPWTWDTITGKAKRPGSVAFYATNAEGNSRWGGMDFDAHDGDTVRARDYAFKGFAVVRQHPELYVAVTTSAGDVESASSLHLQSRFPFA